MTVVIINAISVKEGGSLVVLNSLLAEMVAMRPDWQWHVVTNSEARLRLNDFNSTVFHIYRQPQNGGWKVRLWYEMCLPKLIKQLNADLLFSQTNYLPSRKLSCPALLLVQHAGHFSQEYKDLVEEHSFNLFSRIAWKLKGLWVNSSVRRAQMVTVQTEALAKNIVQVTGVSKKRLCVIAHGTGQCKKFDHLPNCPDVVLPLRIGYITKYGVQKNFSVLFAAFARLHDQGIKAVLILTLSRDLPENQVVFKLARQFGIEEFIENHGELLPLEVDALYSTLHLFIFPSLCESFGFPMLEAMSHALPLLIGKTDSNIEVAGKAGIVFEPYDGTALADLIIQLIKDPTWYKDCSKASQERAAEFSWHKAAIETLALMDRLHRTKPTHAK